MSFLSFAEQKGLIHCKKQHKSRKIHSTLFFFFWSHTIPLCEEQTAASNSWTNHFHWTDSTSWQKRSEWFVHESDWSSSSGHWI